jgi:hypothetical protein
MKWILGAIPLSLLTALAAQQPATGMLTGRAERRAAYRNEPVQQAVRAGLTWLVAHQAADGRFGCATFAELDPPGQECDGAGNPAYDVGATALALLALLAGADPEHQDPARQAADWLLSQLDRESGRFKRTAADSIYEQVLATLALIESHAILGGGRYGPAASAGLRYLDAHRNPGAAWRYQPRDGENDASVTSWCIATYCAAVHAGLEASAETVAEALVWFEAVTIPYTGYVGYSLRGESSSRMPEPHLTKFPIHFGTALVGPALHARSAALWPPRDPLTTLGLAVLHAKPPTNEPKARDFYSWFHAATVVADAARGPAQAWQKAAQTTLLRLQRKDGSYLGSWDPTGVWGSMGGRVCTTAFATLTLAAPWRQPADGLSHVLPDVVPFRAAHARWRAGQPGAAREALAELLAIDLTPEQRTIAERASWFATVSVRASQLFAANAAKHYPDAGERLLRTQQLVTAFGGDPAVADLLKFRADLEATPGAKEALAALRELEELLATFDTSATPKEGAKRRALQAKFRKLLERHGKTPSAERIQWWMDHFGR